MSPSGRGVTFATNGRCGVQRVPGTGLDPLRVDPAPVLTATIVGTAGLLALEGPRNSPTSAR